jgi:SNF2 family DNA or RNA helicase
MFDQMADDGLIFLHGSMTKHEKAEAVKSINTKKNYIALMTFDLGSTGHNFQSCDHIMFADRHWNPQVRLLLTTL